MLWISIVFQMDASNFAELLASTAQPENPVPPVAHCGVPVGFDPFLLEGDAHTWDLEDWNWDPLHMFAAQKEMPAGLAYQSCKRRRMGVPQAELHQAPSGACHTPSLAPFGTSLYENAGDVGILDSRLLRTLQSSPESSPSDAVRTSWSLATRTANNPALPVETYDNVALSHDAWSTVSQPVSLRGHSMADVCHDGLNLCCRANPLQALGYVGNSLDHATNLNVAPIAQNWEPTPSSAFTNATATCCSMQNFAADRFASCGASEYAPAVQGQLADKDVDSSVDVYDTAVVDKEDADSIRRCGDTLSEDSLAPPELTEDGKLACQVPGCGKDLTGLKEYHQRYRICEVHIKLPQVMKEGKLQRFCQQCGRFHDLNAFDGNRKSCREQLSKHNARRRRRAQLENQKTKLPEKLLPLPVDDNSEVGKMLHSLMQNPSQLHALKLLLGVQTNSALPSAAQISAFGRTELASACASSDDAGTSDPPAYSLARNILSGKDEFAPKFDSEHRALRLSLKLFNRTPADLPADLRPQLLSWLQASPVGMESYIRPGCVYLTVQFLVETSTYLALASGGVAALLEHLLWNTGCKFWHQGVFLAQVFDQLGVVSGGQILHKMPVNSLPETPRITSLSPVCVVGSELSTVKVAGTRLAKPNSTIICRFKGQTVLSEVGIPPGSCHEHTIKLHTPEWQGCGTALVELSCGSVLTNSKPIMVVDDPAVAAEINRLSVEKLERGQEELDSLLVDLGLVFQHLSGQAAVGCGTTILAEKARRTLAFACDMGWVHVAAKVLPLASCKCSCAADVVAAIHASTTRYDGLSLLHRAVRSGSLELVKGVLNWGVTNGYQWLADHSGPSGVTPLHLAALQHDARIALALLDYCSPNSFTQVRTYDGVTPFHLALQMGHYEVDILVEYLTSSKISFVLEKLFAEKAKDSEQGCKKQSDQELDPCEVCQSTLPPLLMSIIGRCDSCGARRSCLNEDKECEDCCGCCPPHTVSEPAVLDHQHHTVYSITAMCQTCHTNRVLEVA